ncbi:cytochrome P450 [Cynara cardunculus var. scolymus]|uniref:Cytochrome P450 n=1 Tax=Cynara cardunculus var. scolymus TaxID=59895 RepID=A0A103XLN1_CYNCS|nr:cytochrome P450 [Cynara cardunculus var. scolymus]
MDVILSAVVLLFFTFIFIFINKCRRSWISSSSPVRSMLLGTMGWPFIGETLDFISCGYTDHPQSFMDKRRLLYGKVFKSHLFGSPTIVSTDAEVSRFVLQSDANSFVPSYPKSLTELMGESSILRINGNLHRRIHGLIGAFFKSPYLKAQIAFQVLAKTLIGLDPGEEMEYLRIQFQKFVAGLMSLPLKLPGTQLHRSLQAKKKMGKLVYKIIRDKRMNVSPDSRDVADVLLNDKSEKLTDELISDNMIDLMIPGEDSEENLELKMRKEDLGEQLCWDDYLSMPFTQSVITETLRMGNIIMGVIRKAMKDVEERDMSSGSSSCFTPFGGGLRLCPGLDLARLEASIFLHHFVTKFRWVAEEDTIINFPTVRMKKKMPIWVKRDVHQ